MVARALYESVKLAVRRMHCVNVKRWAVALYHEAQADPRAEEPGAQSCEHCLSTVPSWPHAPPAPPPSQQYASVGSEIGSAKLASCDICTSYVVQPCSKPTPGAVQLLNWKCSATSVKFMSWRGDRG